MLGACTAAMIMPVGSAFAQGSIYGAVMNEDFSTPPNGTIVFFGFINDTDNEVRLPGCIGAGYEDGFWYDDFQNFMGAFAGVPYRYYFYDTVRTEYSFLSGAVPNNSFQQEDIDLESIYFPPIPTGLTATKASETSVLLTWDEISGQTWHVYRRTLPSAGSFFRVDVPSGSLSTHGLGTASFTNVGLDPEGAYEYVIVAEESGVYSPPSEVATVSLYNCCTGLVGDVNGQGGDEPTIGDVSKLIDHLFINLSTPDCLGEADVNQSGGANPTRADITIGDVSLLIDHLFVTFPPIPYCDDAGTK